MNIVLEVIVECSLFWARPRIAGGSHRPRQGLVTTECERVPAGHVGDHRLRHIVLGRAACLAYPADDEQPLAVLHQQMTRRSGPGQHLFPQPANTQLLSIKVGRSSREPQVQSQSPAREVAVSAWQLARPRNVARQAPDALGTRSFFRSRSLAALPLSQFWPKPPETPHGT